MDDYTLPAIDAARHDIARDATYEVQVLAEVLRRLLEEEDSGSAVTAVARGMLSRIYDLSDIIFESVIQDEDQRESVADLMKKLGTTHAARYAKEGEAIV